MSKTETYGFHLCLHSVSILCGAAPARSMYDDHRHDSLFFSRWRFASGAASLIYQIVWMRRLALVFGNTTLATSTVLAAFLAGLAIRNSSVGTFWRIDGHNRR